MRFINKYSQPISKYTLLLLLNVLSNSWCLQDCFCFYPSNGCKIYLILVLICIFDYLLGWTSFHMFVGHFNFFLSLDILSCFSIELLIFIIMTSGSLCKFCFLVLFWLYALKLSSSIWLMLLLFCCYYAIYSWYTFKTLTYM